VKRTADEGAAAWEAIADGWAERMRTNTDWNRPVILDRPHQELVGEVRGLRVLDAGCGEGRFARMLAQRGASVTGIDLSARMIAHARANEEEAPLGIEYRVADMSDQSQFGDASFDLAVAYLSIIDVPDYRRAISEIARVLAGGGRFVFSIVHPCFYTPDSSWEPRIPGIVPVRDRDRLYLKVDNYFPAREMRFRMWPTAPAETVNYHRPLSDYAGALRDAGFLIRDILEPTPDPELAEKMDALKAFFRAPNFLIFDCLKAASP
jgi:SAM-dependent methyltransferase